MFEKSRRKGGYVSGGLRPHGQEITDEIQPIEQGGKAMKFQDWKKLSARRKAIWPGDMKGYLGPQHKVTINIDSDLAAWLISDVVGRSSFTGDLEEAVITALRVMRGELRAGYFPTGPRNRANDH
ncbi:hypothetical protein CN213_06055 [Sinorhizobium meliloti]|uniref:hypothetical protein n=1 Tax=Rhizobium meliloti TaxID=382 RepID=UPI000FDB2A39|nr:hypothetical protein [Sinorhizobium meliloti]RVH60066.1 hypothetical protein CN213_06055 [Sinorhizobium meliloti]